LVDSNCQGEGVVHKQSKMQPVEMVVFGDCDTKCHQDKLL